MELSVIIPTHNRASLVSRVTRAFLAEKGVEFEVIVVDDGSSDDTAERLGAIPDPRLRLVRQPNQKLAAARNRGLQEARGTHVLFNDDDIIPEPGFLLAHLEAHRLYPGSAIVSRVRVPDAVARTPFQRYWQARLHAGTDPLKPGQILGKGGFWAASISFLRQDLPERPFGEFPAYGWEEHELGLRLWRRGVRPRFWPKAQAWHYDPVTLEAMLEKWRSMGRMAWRFYATHKSLEVALWTGTHPLSLALKRWLYPWSKAEALLAERFWEEREGAAGKYRFLLEAAYTQGLLEGRLR
ncbi:MULTISPECIES: glycosyltransferase family 2 protein [unclassified Meiothermus]|uniref:glycosyltransferase family 2 protein n=1 Tax=unclassified Meiothermus TaxID=370471 RepID=UPI000D7BE551|nr:MULTISPECIES: glycosyltransferase family 2 protein [unclassified Meiothermus]PZA07590.1 glycosyltransferase family 2 protein [Meiothermus sp. Pnk-1]RYM36806.1 glycosyltransferase family 2 protein [Meiothermus sp. PNK-Is4]